MSHIITFGKYAGNSIEYILQTDKPYIEWMSINLSNVWGDAAKLLLQGKDISHLQLPFTNTAISLSSRASFSLVDPLTVEVSFQYHPDLVERIKMEIDGRKWNATNKTWTFPISQFPKAIALFGGELNATLTKEAKEELEKELQRKKDLNIIRDKKDTVLHLPQLKLPLFDFQRVGAEFIIRAGGRGMIADSMGVGKTLQGIALSLHYNSKTLVVCPLSVVLNWKKQIKKFTGLNCTIWTTKGNDGSLKNQFHIVHYDIVAKILPEILKQNFELLICDEATNLRNRKTIKAKAILGSYREKDVYPGIKTPYLVFLTGTPIINKPIECFTLLNALDSNRFNNWYHFVNRYGGWKGSPPRNLNELHERSKDLIIRRRKEDVLVDLPPLQRNDLHIELSAADIKEYDKYLADLFNKWKTNGKPSVVEMAALQQWLLERKMTKMEEIIDSFIEENRSLLIFSCYLEPLHKLHKKYKQSVVLHGTMNKTKRQETIDALAAGTKKIGLFSLHAGSMGIDSLQESIDTVIFMDQSWLPSEHEQGEGRLHRQGAKNKIQSFYLLCEDTIDEYMREILSEKQRVIDEAVDGALVTASRNTSYFKEFVRLLSTKYKSKIDI